MKQTDVYQDITWKTQFFGGYTLSMTLTGLFLGTNSLYSFISVATFIAALYFYAKNKEQIEFEKEINKKLKNV